MDVLGWTHTLLACGALILGGATLLRRKGDRLHRNLGHLYVSALVGVDGTALAIYDLFGGFGPFHWAALVSLLTLVVGVFPAVLRRPHRTWLRIHAFWMSWSYVGLLAAAASEAATRLLHLPFWISVGVGTLSVVAVGGWVIARRVPGIIRKLAPAVAALAVGFVPLSAGAQPGPASPGIGGAGGTHVGFIRLDLDRLNRELRSAGLPTVDETTASIGGAGHIQIGRVVVGLEGQGLLESRTVASSDGRRIRVDGGYGLLRLGWALRSGPPVRISPSVGAGLGGMAVTVDAPGGERAFADILERPDRHTHLSAGGLLVEVGMAIDWRLAPGEGRRGPFLGVRAGYVVNPGRWQWERTGGEAVPGAPTARLEGPYLRIVVGGWGGGSPGRR